MGFEFSPIVIPSNQPSLGPPNCDSQRMVRTRPARGCWHLQKSPPTAAGYRPFPPPPKKKKRCPLK